MRKNVSLVLALCLALALNIATPTRAAGNADVLTGISYLGDSSACRMSRDMALAYAGVVNKWPAESDWFGSSGAALVDAGQDGYPLLLVGNSYYDEAIDETSGDLNLYEYRNGIASVVPGPSSYALGKLGGTPAVLAYDPGGGAFEPPYRYHILTISGGQATLSHTLITTARSVVMDGTRYAANAQSLWDLQQSCYEKINWVTLQEIGPEGEPCFIEVSLTPAKQFVSAMLAYAGASESDINYAAVGPTRAEQRAMEESNRPSGAGTELTVGYPDVLFSLTVNPEPLSSKLDATAHRITVNSDALLTITPSTRYGTGTGNGMIFAAYFYADDGTQYWLDPSTGNYWQEPYICQFIKEAPDHQSDLYKDYWNSFPFDIPQGKSISFTLPFQLINSDRIKLVVMSDQPIGAFYYEFDFDRAKDATGLTEDFTVVPTSQNLRVDGAKRDAEIYNIDGANYFKLRDVAMLLNGTGSQFSVNFDAAANTIVVETGKAYKPVGGELATGTDKSATTVKSSQSLRLDGDLVDLTAYNIGGNNFFKLRDLGAWLNFDVDYDDATHTMLVTSR